MSLHRQNADLRTLCILPTRRRRLSNPIVVSMLLVLLFSAWAIAAQMDIDAKRPPAAPTTRPTELAAAYQRGVADAVAEMRMQTAGGAQRAPACSQPVAGDQP